MFLLQIKKTSSDKAKKVEKMSKEFAAMEEAAMKAYEDDMKRLKAEAGNMSLYSFTQYQKKKLSLHIPMLFFLLNYSNFCTSLSLFAPFLHVNT